MLTHYACRSGGGGGRIGGQNKSPLPSASAARVKPVTTAADKFKYRRHHHRGRVLIGASPREQAARARLIGNSTRALASPASHAGRRERCKKSELLNFGFSRPTSANTSEGGGADKLMITNARPRQPPSRLRRRRKPNTHAHALAEVVSTKLRNLFRARF